MRKAIAIILVLLFVGLGFNAYACLIPIYGELPIGMSSNCSEPMEQPAGQFCDGFKNLGIQASPASDLHDLHSVAIDSAAFPVSTPLSFILTADDSRWQHPPIESHPLDLCSSTVVLRI
ncbi:MAG TPA: hypothetical protein VJ692_09080 [Nitrospiraceae bacterium]|nr:hypothetical protein [Nitrospiraceae bacterium]